MKKTTLDPDRKITVQISDDSELELRLKRIIAPPGQKISLRKDYDPSFTADFKNKKAAQKKLEKNIVELAEYQDILYAQDTYALLIIFQAMDAAGKDGAIKPALTHNLAQDFSAPPGRLIGCCPVLK